MVDITGDCDRSSDAFRDEPENLDLTVNVMQIGMNVVANLYRGCGLGRATVHPNMAALAGSRGL